MSDDNQLQPTVLDIGAEQLGKPYARALVAAAASEGVADEVFAQLSEIVDEGLAKNPSLAAVLESPRIGRPEKNRIIERLFGDQVHSVLIRGMKVMNAHGRLGYLPAVRDAAAKILDEQVGRVVAEVRTAVPLTDDLRGEILHRLGESLGKHIRLQESVDTSLIGGMLIRVGDTLFDTSVSGRLNKLGRAVHSGFAQKLMQQSTRFIAEDRIDSADEDEAVDAT